MRTTLLTGAVVALLLGCGGTSTETRGNAGTGGTSGSGGSGGTDNDPGAGGEGDASATGGSSGKGGSGSAGKGGPGGKGGSSGTSGSGGSSASGSAGVGGGSGASPGGGAGTGGEAGGAGGGVAIDDAAGIVATDLCTKAFECCSAEEIQASQGIGSVGQCMLAVATIVQLEVNAAKPALDAGRVAYDGTALERCLNEYGSRSCDMLRTITSFECEGLLVPKQAEGDECGLSVECIDGYCDGSNNATNPVGACAPTKDDGADCSANAECASGFCDAGSCGMLASVPLCGG